MLAPVVLFCLVPYGACTSLWVPYSRLCEDAGGVHVEIADVSHVCQMPEPVDAAHPCPPRFGRSPDEPTQCVVSALVPAACIPPGDR